jgi:uncharacterized protein (TIGR02444 family)
MACNILSTQQERVLDLDNFFWQFSQRLYAQPGVAKVCLALQDECGIDVNLVLFISWLAELGKEMTSTEFENLQAHVQEWRSEVVENLRLARRYVKPRSHAKHYAELKRCELNAERIQQAMMYDFFLGFEPRVSATRQCIPHQILIDFLSESARVRAAALLVELEDLASIADLRN